MAWPQRPESTSAEQAFVRSIRVAVAALTLLVIACAPQGPTSPRPGTAKEGAEGSPARTKVLNIGISTPPSTFSLLAATAPAGGWVQVTELHTDGLITAEPASRRPIGRLAETVPSLENGGLAVLPDGRLRAQFPLRKGVTWHDGQPFTAQDLAFSFAVGGPDGIPTGFNEPMRRMESAEATDDATLVVTYRAPYYLATALGPHGFWPLPKHLLGDAHQRYLQTKSLDDLLLLPYWTSEYVSLGPFRLTSFDPGQRISFQAYDGYFLGRPKIDMINLLIISEQNTLLSSLLAGSIQVAPASALVAEAGLEAKHLWDSNGQGTVHVKEASLRLLESQFQPSIQSERTFLDPRMRRAFYHALDREQISEVLNGSRDRVAWSLLTDDDPLYPAVKDGLRQFTHDTARARALLAEVGWTASADGSWRHSTDGRPLRTSIWGTPGRDQEMNIYASYWRALGVDVEEYMAPPARYRERQFRAQFPGWDYTGAGLVKMMLDPAAAASNNWTGNVNGYEDPRSRRLVDALETTIVPQEQLAAMKAINDFAVAELPALPIYFLVQYTAVHGSVKAFDDIAGADGSERLYGGYARNAYLWDLR